MPSYRPNYVQVTTVNNGTITNAASVKMSSWNRVLLAGYIKTSTGTALTNIAVKILRVSAGKSTGSTLGVVFTNIYGEYGVSLPTLASDKDYRIVTYTDLSV